MDRAQIVFPFGDLATPREGMKIDALELFAHDHHGLVTRDVALRRGMSRFQWYKAIESGLLEPIHPGVCRLCGAPPTREQAIAAAVLGAGPGAMASHRSAAHLWGIPRTDDDPLEIILPVRTRRATLDGVIVHRPRDRRDLSPVLRQNIRTSNVLRLLCDLGAVDEPSVHAAVGHVLGAGMASPHALRTAIDAHTRRGRHGVPAFRAALDAWMIDGKPAEDRKSVV